VRASLLLCLIALLLLPVSLLAQTTGTIEGGYGDRPDLVFPPIDGREVLVADLHMHTTHSDGKLTPRERVLECYLVGYTAIAITDHGTPAAYAEAKALADELGMVLVRGMESGIDGDEHLVILGISEQYKPRDSHKWARTKEQATAGRAYYQDQLREIADAGGIVYYPHPDHGWTPEIEWAREQGILVGTEMLNSDTTEGWGTVMHLGRPCYPFALDWAGEKGLACLANSDIHGPHAKTPPRGRTLVLVDGRTPEAVVDALREGRTLAWFPPGGDRWDSPEMLWATPGMLSAYVDGVVRVEPRELEEGKPPSGAVLTNLGAVPLEARVLVDGTPQAELTLEQGHEYLVPTAGESLTIEWPNLWVGSDTTWKTEYTLDDGAWVAGE
jgi:hypothetical protein